MAAGRLADELLQMILAPSLTISQYDFVSGSPTAFGGNDNVSSASVLLVCKRWLRVATPMLYETVIIRSAGQSQALANVFGHHTAFSKHVKNLRLEGAYPYLEDVLPSCTNLVTLVLLLHIYSEASATGLCRSLPLINPVEVILHDKWMKDNSKVRKVFIALCDAIPKWTNLTSFQYPYGLNEGRTPIDPGSGVPRHDRLIDALVQCKSLRMFYSNISLFYGEQWRRLARASSITFKFRYFPRAGLDLEKLQILGIKETSQLPNTTIEFVELSKKPTPKKHKLTIETEPMPSFKNMTFKAIDDNIWNTILTFAALPDHPNPPDMYSANFHCVGAGIFNYTCKALSHTCKRFEQLIRPLLFAFPMILSHASMEQFTKKILDNPSLGSRVRVITIQFNTFVDQNEIREKLNTLLPRLTGLFGFNCQGRWSWVAKFALTTKALALLAEASGSTIATLTGFTFLSNSAPSLAALASFKNLRVLDIPSNGSRPGVDSPVDPDCFANIQTLRIDGPGPLFDDLCKLSLPTLRSVTFHRASAGIVEQLFKKSGLTIEELIFKGVADLANVFSLAPNLLHVEWEPGPIFYKDANDSVMVGAAFSKLAAHQKLKKLTLRNIPRRGVGEKEQNTAVTTVFSQLELSNFPSLKEIHFRAYRWPVEERSISKQVLPKQAVTVRQEHGIEIKDGSGKSWRARAQRHR